MFGFGATNQTIVPARESSPLAASVAAIADDKLAVPLARYRELIVSAACGAEVAPAELFEACQAAGKPIAEIDRVIDVCRDGLRMRREMIEAKAKIPALEAASEEAFAKWHAMKDKLRELTAEVELSSRAASAAGNQVTEAKTRANDRRYQLTQSHFVELLGEPPASVEAIPAK